MTKVTIVYNEDDYSRCHYVAIGCSGVVLSDFLKEGKDYQFYGYEDKGEERGIILEAIKGRHPELDIIEIVDIYGE